MGNRIDFSSGDTFRARIGFRAQSFRPKGFLSNALAMEFSVFAGGGNIGRYSVLNRNGELTNILWQAPWELHDPQQVGLDDPAFDEYGGRDVRKRCASVGGSSFCFPAFGPGKMEETGGLHSEANIVPWTLNRSLSGETAMVLQAELPITGWSVARRFQFVPGGTSVEICTSCENKDDKNKNITWAEHMNFGAFALASRLYLPYGTSVHNFPGDFGGASQFLKEGGEEVWPFGLCKTGALINLSTFSPAENIMSQSDFTAQVFPKDLKYAWFLLHNPKLGIAMMAAWKREDAPFLARWIENRSKTATPWSTDGKIPRTQVLGLEPSNTPFPLGIQKSVALAQLSGIDTFETARPKNTFYPAKLFIDAIQTDQVNDPKALVEKYLLSKMK
ncbi:MAG: hypothetical protein NTZ10_05620 [Candidatus Saganbacteria bacterium]|nr:hypothetical protein [Candidatus Saganbacteria bacterium]